jgi:hypothetical protein
VITVLLHNYNCRGAVTAYVSSDGISTVFALQFYLVTWVTGAPMLGYNETPMQSIASPFFKGYKNASQFWYQQQQNVLHVESPSTPAAIAADT